MNPDRAIYGRITIDGTKTSLGKAMPHVMMQRILESWLSAPAKNTKGQAIVEWSFEPLPDSTILDRESQLMNEFNSLATKVDPAACTMVEGVTDGEYFSALEIPEFIAYRELAANPQARIGMTREQIDEVISAWRELKPAFWDKILPWRDS